MTHYLEGYVRARQTLAEIERRAPGNDSLSERPDARTLKRRLGHVAVTVRRTTELRPTTVTRSRLSGA